MLRGVNVARCCPLIAVASQTGYPCELTGLLRGIGGGCMAEVTRVE
jgi:hypothetical protein